MQQHFHDDEALLAILQYCYTDLNKQIWKVVNLLKNKKK